MTFNFSYLCKYAEQFLQCSFNVYKYFISNKSLHNMNTNYLLDFTQNTFIQIVLESNWIIFYWNNKSLVINFLLPYQSYYTIRNVMSAFNNVTWTTIQIMCIKINSYSYKECFWDDSLAVNGLGYTMIKLSWHTDKLMSIITILSYRNDFIFKCNLYICFSSTDTKIVNIFPQNKNNKLFPLNKMLYNRASQWGNVFLENDTCKIYYCLWL